MLLRVINATNITVDSNGTTDTARAFAGKIPADFRNGVRVISYITAARRACYSYQHLNSSADVQSI